MTLAFTVFGVPQPKGSTKAFMPRGARFPVVTSDNDKNRGWQQLVADGASRAIAALPPADRVVARGPMRLVAIFHLPRPKIYATRTIAPPHVRKPDLDKLVRSCTDALTRVVWIDDSQVIDLVAQKVYAVDVPRVDIRVEPAHRAAVATLFGDRDA